MDPPTTEPRLAVEPPRELSARIRARVADDLSAAGRLSMPARRAVGIGVSALALSVIYALLLAEGQAGNGHAARALIGGVVALAGITLWSMGRAGSVSVSVGTRLVFAATPLLALFALTVVSRALFPDAQGIFRTGFGCFRNGVIISVIPMAALLVLWRRSDPFTPRLTGALVGGLAGLTGAVALVMACPSKDPIHLFVAHGAAVGAGALFGAVVGRRLLAP